MKLICWSILLLAILLPVMLGILKRTWTKISITKLFQPDFISPFRILFFGGIRDNTKFSSSGENYFVLLVILFTLGVCTNISGLLLQWFPDVADLPDVATAAIGTFSTSLVLLELFSFLRKNKPSFTQF